MGNLDFKINEDKLFLICQVVYPHCWKAQNNSVSKKRTTGALITDLSIFGDIPTYTDDCGNDAPIYTGFIPSCTGYNRNILCGANPCENSNNETFITTVHAEEKAIIKYLERKSFGNAFHVPAIFCTYAPCAVCARLIIHAGIKVLIFNDKHDVNFDSKHIDGDMTVLQMLINAGISVYQYTIDEQDSRNAKYVLTRIYDMSMIKRFKRHLKEYFEHYLTKKKAKIEQKINQMANERITTIYYKNNFYVACDKQILRKCETIEELTREIEHFRFNLKQHLRDIYGI